MYDPETPWIGGGGFMEEMVTSVIKSNNPRTVKWKELKKELKALILDYHEKHDQPMQASQVWLHLIGNNREVNVTLDFKLLVILLNNLGGITVYSHPSELRHKPLL